MLIFMKKVLDYVVVVTGAAAARPGWDSRAPRGGNNQEVAQTGSLSVALRHRNTITTVQYM